MSSTGAVIAWESSAMSSLHVKFLIGWQQTALISISSQSFFLRFLGGASQIQPFIWRQARLAGVEPAHCVYVGDNLKRDITGTRQAGFGMVIILLDASDSDDLQIPEDNKPDLIIHEFCQLLDIFPLCPIVRFPEERAL